MYGNYPQVTITTEASITIVDDPEFFLDDIKPVYVKIGKDLSWKLPTENQNYTIGKI